MMADFEQRMQMVDKLYDVNTTVEMFYNTVTNYGDRPANMFMAEDGWKTITYREWADVSEEIGNTFLSLGLKVGDNIAIMAPTCAEWGWADMGAEMAGGCTTTIFPSAAVGDMKFILNHSEITYLFCGDPTLLQKAMNEWQDVPSLKGIICLKGGFEGDGTRTWNFEQFRQMGRSYCAAHTGELDQRIKSLKPTDAASTVYTSGTTGVLKAARLTHKDWVIGVWRTQRQLLLGNFTSDFTDIYFCIMPLAHVMERTYGYFSMMAIGALIAYGRGPKFMMEDIGVVRPTWICWVPRMLSRVVSALEAKFSAAPGGKEAWDWSLNVGSRMIDARLTPQGTLDASKDPLEDLTGQLREDYIKAKEMVFDKVHAALGGRMRIINSGGAALLPELHKVFLGMGYVVPNGWGLTETVCGLSVTEPNLTKISWNARQAPGLEIKRDTDGEALVKGGGVITEYYNDPESTATNFTEDGWFRTGDIIEIDELGIIRVVDRKKAIIVMDTGKNVAQARVEAFMLRDSFIDQAFIVGDGRKFISALIVPVWDQVVAVFRSKGIAFDESKLVYDDSTGIHTCVAVGEDIVTNPLLIEMVEKAVQDGNAELAPFEQVKEFRIIPRKLSQAYDELTPTLKTKNKVVEKNWAREIESIYA
ncbi:MAG: AMP-binding protein [Bacillota bacterium]|nr:AMP-binding protein [Bacillota bacterium]